MFVIRSLRVSSPNKSRLVFKFYHNFRSKLRICSKPNEILPRLSYGIIARNRFCTKSDDYDPEIDILDEIDNKDGLVYDSESINLISPKLILYPNTNDDPVLSMLSDAQNEDELCRVILQNRNKFNHRHIVQSILMRWELAILDNTLKLDDATYLEKTEFQWILREVPNHLRHMNYDELTCCLLYLNKLGLHIKSGCLQSIITECLKRIKNLEDFPLTALSRFSVALHSVHSDIYMYLVCQDIMPMVLDKLNRCDNDEDLRMITICLNNLHKMISTDSLNVYTAKVIELLENGVLNKDSVRPILKIIHFLNYPYWSQDHLDVIRRLSLMVEDSIPKFQTRELIALFKVLQSHIEPASMIPAITNHAQHLLKTSQSVDLLTCSVLYSLPQKRVELTEVAKSILGSIDLQPTQLAAMFKVLRLLKISNLNLVNSYWDKVVTDIKSNQEQRESYRIAQNCHRYMHFNNNLGGTYRHCEFEWVMSSIIVDELKNGLSFHIPSKFVKLASFVIAYGMAENDHKSLEYPDFMFTKIEEIKHQLTILDCLQLSRGLQIAYEMRFRRFIPKIIACQLARVENVLNMCTERHIEFKNLTLTDLNLIIRSFNNRKSSRTTQLFNKIITKYDEFAGAKLTSRLIRDITFNLTASNYRSERIMNELLDYVHENREYVTGDTVEKVVYCCFNLGYVPENSSGLQSAIAIINRDFNYMSGLSITQACLALSYFKVLPENLINRVFNIDFIQRLEDEITMCYSKATYPERVLNQVMQLNRAVCLDYPETRVPWFQQNYIEAQLSKQPKINTPFHVDVKRFLDAILPESESLKCDLVTPYGYRIDFALFLDKNKKFVPSSSQRKEKSIVQSSLKKIAILLPRLESLCENNPNYFHGAEYLKQRHLEILGFKVIHINYNTWYSMYMNIPNAKLNYLKNLLEIEKN